MPDSVSSYLGIFCLFQITFKITFKHCNICSLTYLFVLWLFRFETCHYNKLYCNTINTKIFSYILGKCKDNNNTHLLPNNFQFLGQYTNKVIQVQNKCVFENINMYIKFTSIHNQLNNIIMKYIKLNNIINYIISSSRY